jgi:hypothetical protein
MRRLWWPTRLYEARPYGALTLGLLGGLIALGASLAIGSWRPMFMTLFVLGCGVMIYGGIVLQTRYEYRRRSRWRREHKD